ncbi:MAG: porin family protein [Pseudomonadota bacterium]
MSKSSILATSVVAAAICVAPSAAAQGFYIDGGYAAFKGDSGGDDEDALADDETDLTLGLIGGHYGYDFSPYAGVEAELLFGVKNDSGSVSGIDYDLNINVLAGAFAKAQLPLGDRFTAFARAGYFGATVEATFPGLDIDSEEETEFDVALGVGATFAFTDKSYLRADLTRYGDQGGSDGLMLGIGHRF